jgi:hypothetical protein
MTGFKLREDSKRFQRRRSGDEFSEPQTEHLLVEVKLAAPDLIRWQLAFRAIRDNLSPTTHRSDAGLLVTRSSQSPAIPDDTIDVSRAVPLALILTTGFYGALHTLA